MFAHKLLTLVQAIPQREGKELLVVSAEEICEAMGQLQKAELEKVQLFVFDVIEFMTGYGLYIACGCGYLSLMVRNKARSEEIMKDRNAFSFAPGSVDSYLED